MKMLIAGMLSGALLALLGVAMALPRLMVAEVRSPLGYEETLEKLQSNVTNGGWKVSAVMRLDQSLAKEGRNVLPAASIKICQPDHAERVLKEDGARFLSVMMPCSIGVYEKSDGYTYIASMNAGLIGRMFGGVVAETMAGPVARETWIFVENIN